MKRLLLRLIGFYRRSISPNKKPCCRFTPTCSQYAFEAIERYGALRGGFLALRRLLRCHPFCPGGYDPVPIPSEQSSLGIGFARKKPSAK